MHAKQAHKMAINVERTKVLLQIKKAATDGQFCLCVEKLDLLVVEALKRWGYQVDLSQTGICHYIYWVVV